MGAHRAANVRGRRTLTGLLVAAMVPVIGLATPLVPANAANDAGFTKTKTVVRQHTAASGSTAVVDQRNVTVKIDQTTDLRNRQEVKVSWTGAHPTGGLADDPTSLRGSQQEYPVVVMQCRGVDSTAVPASQRISPQTCWTQTPDERWQYSSRSNYPPFRVDRYGSAADHGFLGGAPDPWPSTCSDSLAGLAQHWVPFVSASGKVYAGGKQGCAGLAPEATTFGDASVPNNTTYGISDLEGDGSASFVIQSAATNASQGCSVSVKCSLVVIPIMGVSCDVAPVPEGEREAANALCTKTGYYQPGDRANNENQQDQAVSGQLWWSASNWRNRITTPISFAPSADACAVDGDTPMYVYGSELMTQAMGQWQPYFCLTKGLFDVQHVQTGEPAAKNLLRAGSINAAFEAQPPADGYPRPIARLPVAFTGFVVAFRIDDANGQPLTTLRMTPRLIAKLLTESYPGGLSEHTDLAGNPTGIDSDPEFRALNPNVPRIADQGSGNGYAAQMIIALGSESDLTYAVTSYLQADPDAREWLDGKPDQWGMKVNPAYKGIDLPLARWPLLDDFVPSPEYFARASCPDVSVPWMPLVASPVSALATATLDLQFGIGPSQVNCVVTGDAQKFASKGRQAVGKRFLIGLTSLADALRYKIPTASLKTGSGSGAFTAPSSSALTNTAKLLSFDKDSGTWPIPVDTLRTSKGATAYPGAMLVSMDVPTTGLTKADAAKYATFLRFAVGAGQTPGTGNGQLPRGYLPMTAAYGLAAQSAYTAKTATTVQTQSGLYATPAASGGGSGSGGGGTGGGGGGTNGGSGATGSNPPVATGGAPGGAQAAAPTVAPSVAPGAPTALLSSIRTASTSSGLGGAVIPAFLLLAVLCGLAVPIVVTLGKRSAR